MPDGEAPSADPSAIPAPESSDPKLQGLHGDRKTQRRQGKASQCVYIEEKLHQEAVSYAKRAKEIGKEPKTFSALFHAALREFLDAHPLEEPAPAEPVPPPPGALGIPQPAE